MTTTTNAPGVRITHLRIENYRRIELYDSDIPPLGGVFKGRNGGGKTTVLKAIMAALAARDVGPDAIRIGESKAEILVDLDHYTVRRLITAAGNTLTVETKDGDRKRAPQTWLNELLGTSTIDPIKFFEADAKERKAQLLRALPISITEEQLGRWIGTERAKQIANTGMLKNHGLDVCAALHDRAYANRTPANKTLKEAKEALALHDRQKVPEPEIPISEERAKTAREEADKLLAALFAREERLATAEERTRSTRETIRSHREAAKQLREQYPEPDFIEVERLRDMADLQAEAVKAMEAALLNAREELSRREQAHKEADAAAHDRREQRGKADRRDENARELEATLNATAEQPITDEDCRTVARRVEEAATLQVEALQTKTAETWRTERVAKVAALESAQKIAEDYDLLVATFGTQAPAELLAESNGIKGLAVSGDKILLDGVAIDHVSGREQLLFAVDIARRANAKSKILLVDGIERVDPEQLPSFIERATADGYQLLATRVDKGAVTFEAIATTEES